MSLRTQALYMDMREVERNLRKLNQTILPGRIRTGLRLAGMQLMVDSVADDPTMPIRRPGYPASAHRLPGELRASGAVFVDGGKVGSSVGMGEMAGGKYQPAAYGGETILPNSHEACIVFNAPYAAKQHEAFPKKTEPGAGMYFMSKKLYGNAGTYVSIIVEAIRL